MKTQLLKEYYCLKDDGKEYKLGEELDRILHAKYIQGPLTPAQKDRYVDFFRYFEFTENAQINVDISGSLSQVETLEISNASEIKDLLEDKDRIQGLIDDKFISPVERPKWNISADPIASVNANNLKLRKDYVGNLNELPSWIYVPFYRTSTFITITNVIVTPEKSPQLMFNVLSHHRYNATPLDIEKTILRDIIKDIFDHEGKSYLLDLCTVSSCVYWMEKYEEKESELIKSFTKQKNGKWYFQPDQRCEVVQQLIDENPLVASKTTPFSEWEKSVDEKSVGTKPLSVVA